MRHEFAKQKEARDKSRGRTNFAYFMEMGTGKTKVVVDEFCELIKDNLVNDLLVVAPKGVYRNWETEIPLDVPPEIMKTMMIARWRSGASKKQLLQLEQLFQHEGPRVFLVNVEALSVVNEAVEFCTRFLKARKALMVVDESTTIKSHNAERTGQVINLGGYATVRRILTGTPTPKGPLDLFTQFQFLDLRLLGFGSYYAFRARYAIMETIEHGGRKIKIVVGHRNVDELQEKIQPHSFRVLKEDCLDLPPKVYMPLLEVEMTKEQRRMYDEIKAYATTELDGSHVTATAVITQILRLHQMMCGHVVDEQGKTIVVPSKRLKTLIERLDQAEGKSIIWANYRHSLAEIADTLRKEYGPESVVEYWGDTKDETREYNKHRFQNDRACRFFVSNPQTGGRGITLTAARHVFYYSNSFDLELRQQSEDRAHRAGLEHSVDYTDLCVRGTVDEKIIHALRNKIDVASTITGDTYREWLI